MCCDETVKLISRLISIRCLFSLVTNIKWLLEPLFRLSSEI